MPAFAGLLHCRRRSDLAGQRLVGLCDASAARSSGARAFAIDLAAVPLLAFSLMPLAGAVAINFSAPLFAALVSIVWLNAIGQWFWTKALHLAPGPPRSRGSIT